MAVYFQNTNVTFCIISNYPLCQTFPHVDTLKASIAKARPTTKDSKSLKIFHGCSAVKAAQKQ